MKRISVDEVKAAYEKTGLKPFAGVWFHSHGDDRCGCALGVCCSAMGKIPMGHADASDILGLDFAYTLGFTWGFDGNLMDSYDVNREQARLAGYADGVAAAKAVFA